jgi:hypothetical protein
MLLYSVPNSNIKIRHHLQEQEVHRETKPRDVAIFALLTIASSKPHFS